MVWPGGMTCIRYGLAGMAWYMVWSGGHSMVNGMAWLASHGIYLMAWRGMAWHMLLSGGVWHDMVCLAWHSVSYGLAMYGTVYGMALWAWHGIWYGLAMFGMVGITWYMYWPGKV